MSSLLVKRFVGLKQRCELPPRSSLTLQKLKWLPATAQSTLVLANHRSPAVPSSPECDHFFSFTGVFAVIE